jgi:hypothetical protein
MLRPRVPDPLCPRQALYVTSEARPDWGPRHTDAHGAGVLRCRRTPAQARVHTCLTP